MLKLMRAGALSAACWAAMVHTGEDGYLKVRGVGQSVTDFEEGISPYT